MAFLYVTEFNNMGVANNAPVIQAASQPPIAEQTVANAGASTQSATFNALTRFVRLSTDTACCFAFGTNPTATVANARLAPNTTEYFAVPNNSAFKVAVFPVA